MQIVDTNIVAYLLIDGDHSAAALELRRRDSNWRSESFLLVEFTNVLASSIASKRMTLSQARDFLTEAVTLLDGRLGRLPHFSMLEASVRYQVSAYDARFLALAQQLGLPLVTEDAKLRRAAPNLTQSLDEALSAA